jgi:hypothetical protein
MSTVPVLHRVLIALLLVVVVAATTAAATPPAPTTPRLAVVAAAAAGSATRGAADGDAAPPPPLTCQCFLRGGIDINRCFAQSGYETWTVGDGTGRIGPWVERANLNCWPPGTGATWGTGALPGGQNYTVSACQAQCKANPKCTAITVTTPKVAPPPPPPGGIAFNPGEQIPGPGIKGVRAWRSSMEEWRVAAKHDMNYTGAAFSVPQLEWTQNSWIQPVPPFRHSYGDHNHELIEIYRVCEVA